MKCAVRGTKYWLVLVSVPYYIRIGSAKTRMCSKLSLLVCSAVNSAQWNDSAKFRRIFLEIKHAPPSCFESQTLVSVKVPSYLERPQHIMMPTSEYRVIFSANPAIEKAALVGVFIGPVTQNLPSSSFAPYTSFIRKFSFDRIWGHLSLVSVSSPLVSDVSTLWSSVTVPDQHLIQFCQLEEVHCTHDTKPLNQIEKKYSLFFNGGNIWAFSSWHNEQIKNNI